MILRGVAFAAGLSLLTATAHTTIAATGGYAGSHAVLTLMIAVGVGVGALVIGAACRRGLAYWLLAAMLAGESFGFLMTADRLIEAREARQAPLRDAEAQRAKADQRVTDAKAAIERLPETSPRLRAATGAKAAADASAVEKSVERHCLANCRSLLQAQVDSTEREVAAARDELRVARDAAQRELVAATADAASIRPAPSATPFADRVGIPAWLFDLIIAALGSMAANGLGCGLIAYAGHGRRHEPEVPPPVTVEPASARPAFAEGNHAAQFAFDRLWPSAKGDGADMLAIHAAYRKWCAEKGHQPASGAALGKLLGDVFEGVGISVIERDGRMLAMGVKLAEQTTPLLPVPGKRRLGAMARVSLCR